MKSSVIKVPKGIRYISDWSNYSLNDFQFPHILNKKVTGCGFTEYCISLDNPLNVILCSPRRILLENKEDQHEGEIFYARNDLEIALDFDKDIEKEINPNNNIKSSKSIFEKDEEKKNLKKEESNKNSLLLLKKGVKTWYDRCKNKKIPCKILVTYDSFKYVRDTLKEYLDQFYVVVDEFQSIFIDSRFKSSAELDFVNSLKGLTKICYVSATPMMKKYLEMIPEFCSLPYYELDWLSEDPKRIIKPKLNIRFLKNLNLEANRIIQKYLSGDFEEVSWINDKGNVETVVSREAVLYFNSVNSICKIIKKNKLTIDKVNVLCAKTESNREKLKRALGCSSEESIGSIPKKGEPHKMFTLCTRTTYLGSDFYSTCARSFIFSDSGINCLSVDISMDLNQILGRQRLDENPWKNEADLIVRIDGEIKDPKKFEEYIDKKQKNSEIYLDLFNKAGNSEAKEVLINKIKESKSLYLSDYLTIDKNNRDQSLIFNHLVKISEMRAFEIQQVDYADRFSLLRNLEDKNFQVSDNFFAGQFLNEFNKLTTFPDKIKYLCKYPDEYVNSALELVPSDFKNYFLVLGRDTILKYSGVKCILEKLYNDKKLLNNSKVDPILDNFSVGDKLTKSEIKEKLTEIYRKAGISKKPNATDLGTRFELKRIRLRDENNKRIEGFELLPLEGNDESKDPS